MAMRIITWGPLAGQQLPEEQVAAYNQANPMSDAEYAQYQQANGLSNVNIAAAQPQGSSGATLGPVIKDSIAEFDAKQNATSLGVGDPYWNSFFQRAAAQSGGLQTPGLASGNADADRLAQLQVIQELQNQARGGLNTQAQGQLRQGYQSAGAQQSSLGSSLRGQSAGAAQRSIAAGQQGIQRGFSGDQQMLQLQEQQAAQAALQQMLLQQYGQDISQAQSMAQGALRGRALNQDMRQFYENAGLARDLGIAQLRNEEIRADSGFDLEGKAINNRIARDAVQGGATALSTLSNMPNSTSNNQRTPQEQKIEDAFNS